MGATRRINLSSKQKHTTSRRGEGEKGEEEEEEGGKEGGDLERRDKFSQQTACNTPSTSERPTLKLTRLRDGNPRYRKH